MKQLITFNKLHNNNYEVVFYNGVRLGSLNTEVDGFYYFWPNASRGGYWEAWVLKAIANKMDELNNEN